MHVGDVEVDDASQQHMERLIVTPGSLQLHTQHTAVWMGWVYSGFETIITNKAVFLKLNLCFLFMDVIQCAFYV